MQSKKNPESRSQRQKPEAPKPKAASRPAEEPKAKAKPPASQANSSSSKPFSSKAIPAKKSETPAKKNSPAPASASKPRAEEKPARRAAKKPNENKVAVAHESDMARRDAHLTVSLIQGNHSQTLRPKLFEQLPVQKDYGFPPNAPELPETYHRDRLVLMTKEPDFLFSYWEVTPELLAAKTAAKRNGEQYHEVLKLTWPARSLFDVNFALLPVMFAARRWYLRAPFAGLNYQVDLGWLGSQGHFIVLLSSNETESPESWDATLGRLRGLSDAVDYNARLAQPLGASESLRLEEKHFSITDWNMSSGIFSSSSPVRKSPSEPQPASTLRTLPTELRVEAQLKPGSLLRVGGRELVSDADGRVLAHVAGEGALTVELVLPGGRRHAYTYDLAAMTR